MNLLVVGRGGREHSMIMKLADSDQVDRIYAAPGNGGIREQAVCVDINELDGEGLIDFAREKSVDLTIIGPEDPLMAGIADKFQKAGLRVFAPTADAAILEGSKGYAKNFMQQYGIPTAAYATFTDADEAKAYIAQNGAPTVVKADGLASGKGVVVAETTEEAIRAIDELMVNRALPDTKETIVIEECLQGREISLMAFVHEHNVYPMIPACDHKRAYDDDKGPNTGGMGAYAPAEDIAPEILDDTARTILQRTADGMMQEGRPFTGILYAGLMMTEDGPKVIEYNARFGDPETQVILPLLKNDLLQVFMDVLDGNDPALQWEDKSCAGVVLASLGYPGAYEKGVPLPDTEPDGDVFIIHAGTKQTESGLVTDGGRVLLAGGKSNTLAEAASVSYEWLSRYADSESFFYRRDIGRAYHSAGRNISKK